MKRFECGGMYLPVTKKGCTPWKVPSDLTPLDGVDKITEWYTDDKGVSSVQTQNGLGFATYHYRPVQVMPVETKDYTARDTGALITEWYCDGVDFDSFVLTSHYKYYATVQFRQMATHAWRIDVKARLRIRAAKRVVITRDNTGACTNVSSYGAPASTLPARKPKRPPSNERKTKMKTFATDCGSMITGSLIHVQRENAAVGGYIRTSPRAMLAIALRADDSGWEALYEMGGDWSGVSSDNLLDIVSLGALDDDNNTASEKLSAGAAILKSWADAIDAIDNNNEALAECAEYLRSRAISAEEASGSEDACAEIEAQLN